MYIAEIRAGDIRALDNADNAARRVGIHDGQGQQVIFCKKLEGSVHGVFRSQGDDVVAHEIGGDDQIG